MKSFYKTLIAGLFPQFCLKCRKEGGIICTDCLSTIDIIKNSYGFNLKTTSFVDKIFSAASYQETLLSTMVKKFKYKPFLKNLALPLAYLIISHFLLSENKIMFYKTGENKIIIPVPLHKKKQKQRGFNQSALIAKELALFFNLPLETNNLIKICNTKQQADLNKKEREKNIHGAFLIKDKKAVAGKIIFLIDDVITTGATINECAKVLKQAGAEKVFAISCAFDTLK